jgi:MtN3 and saliva related transmembrane protein
MFYRDVIGWTASAILVLTIATQVYRQWQQGTSKGVSKWLFAGQITASSGFLVYSWLIRDAVFVATNLLLLVAAVVGLSILLYHRATNVDEAEG